MLLGNRSSLIAGALPVVVVIALSAVVALLISAWLLLQVARLAIDKADPQAIPSLIIALGSLLSPLRLFLPWRSATSPEQPPADTLTVPSKGGQTGANPDSSQEAGDGQ